MIRQANKFDRANVIDMMQEFRKASGINQYEDLENIEYWENLFAQLIAGHGVIFLEPDKGLIMGLITKTIWCNKTFALQELAWYVKPEHRGSRTGYRLFKKFIEYAKKLKSDGRIDFFTMSKLNTSPDFDYGRFGFSKMDENWIQ